MFLHMRWMISALLLVTAVKCQPPVTPSPQKVIKSLTSTGTSLNQLKDYVRDWATKNGVLAEMVKYLEDVESRLGKIMNNAITTHHQFLEQMRKYESIKTEIFRSIKFTIDLSMKKLPESRRRQRRSPMSKEEWDWIIFGMG